MDRCVMSVIYPLELNMQIPGKKFIQGWSKLAYNVRSWIKGVIEHCSSVEATAEC